MLILDGYMKRKKETCFQDNNNANETLKIGREINRARESGYGKDKIRQEFATDANRIVFKKRENGSDDVSKEMAREAVRQIKGI